MLIYMMIKIFVSYYVIIKKGWLKSSEELNKFFDIMIISIFFLLVYKNIIVFQNTIYIIKIGLIFFSIFFFYKIIYYFNLNQKKIISWIESKEKIKLWLLKPVVCKSIYYFIWMLPWNIGYWIYFWIMENGWYFRVWYCSNRDIFFKKYFNWDSREFFFNLNEKKENFLKRIYYKKVKERGYEVIGRILIVIYLIRRYIHKIDMKRYIFIRIVVYMYLSIFYLFMFLNLVNYYLLLILLLLEFILIIFFGETLLFLQKRYKIEEKDYYELKNRGIITEEFIEVKNKLRSPMFIDTRLKWEENVFIWDKTLSNSVTLNILYRYMIWVNRNTKGYYDFKMNMRTRIHRKKFLEEKSIIWDVLPRTRYVIVNLKYFGYETCPIVENGVEVDKEYEFINIKRNRNFYLSYYEKAYSKASLTLFIWILRKHKYYWDSREEMFIRSLSEEISLYYKKQHSGHIVNFLCELIYIYKYDKRYFKISMMLVSLFNRHSLFCCEELFFHYYKWYMIENAKKLDIPIEFCSLKDYKIIFKIMGRIQINEEEAIVWNEKLQEMLDKKEELLNREYNEIMFNDVVAEEYKMIYRYNKFFFELMPKDLGVLDENLEKDFELRYKKFNEILKLEPDLMEYFNKYNDGLLLFGIHMSNWQIFPDFKVKWMAWDVYPDEDVLFVLYCQILLQYHCYLSEDVLYTETEIAVKLYDIRY